MFEVLMFLALVLLNKIRHTDFRDIRQQYLDMREDTRRQKEYLRKLERTSK